MNPMNGMASMLARLEELDQIEAKLRADLEQVQIMRAEIHLGKMHDWLSAMENDDQPQTQEYKNAIS